MFGMAAAFRGMENWRSMGISGWYLGNPREKM